MNTNTSMHISKSKPTSQRGATLIVALLFLILITILGISSVSSITLEEKMAGNSRDQQIAFQAAESALRDAEIDLETGIGGGGAPRVLTVAAFATACTGT